MSEDCPYCVYEKNEANCPGCFEGSHYRPKPVTHADRIRAMTDEELAEWVWSAECAGRAYGPMGKKAWLDWLKKEAPDGQA